MLQPCGGDGLRLHQRMAEIIGIRDGKGSIGAFPQLQQIDFGGLHIARS